MYEWFIIKYDKYSDLFTIISRKEQMVVAQYAEIEICPDDELLSYVFQRFDKVHFHPFKREEKKNEAFI